MAALKNLVHPPQNTFQQHRSRTVIRPPKSHDRCSFNCGSGQPRIVVRATP
jgi:hypothetical protein